jgi:hypothetical protein
MSKGLWRAQPTLAVLVAGAVVLAGCSSSTDNDGDTRGAPSEEGASASPRTRSTEPPGSEPDAVRGYLEELLARYDNAVNAIIADPAVVRDRAHPEVQAYLDLFEPGSTVADDALAGWAESADAGMTVRPLLGDSPMIVSSLDGRVETVDDDEVSFATCADHQYQQHDGLGAVQDVVDVVGRAGEGVAVRVDGEWRLRRLELRDDRPACAAEGDNA